MHVDPHVALWPVMTLLQEESGDAAAAAAEVKYGLVGGDGQPWVHEVSVGIVEVIRLRPRDQLAQVARGHGDGGLRDHSSPCH